MAILLADYLKNESFYVFFLQLKPSHLSLSLFSLTRKSFHTGLNGLCSPFHPYTRNIQYASSHQTNI